MLSDCRLEGQGIQVEDVFYTESRCNFGALTFGPIQLVDTYI